MGVVFAVAVFVLQAEVAQAALLAVPPAWELEQERDVPQAAQPVARDARPVRVAALVVHSVVSRAVRWTFVWCRPIRRLFIWMCRRSIRRTLGRRCPGRGLFIRTRYWPIRGTLVWRRSFVGCSFGRAAGCSFGRVTGRSAGRSGGRLFGCALGGRSLVADGRGLGCGYARAMPDDSVASAWPTLVRLAVTERPGCVGHTFG